jgi:hypothetical protein
VLVAVLHLPLQIVLIRPTLSPSRNPEPPP